MDSLMSNFRKGVLLNGRYETTSPLNHGAFGMVTMARVRSTGQIVAIKCFNNSSVPGSYDSGFKVDDRSEELKIHSLIGNNPNIVNLLDSFSTSTHTYLVLEYCSMGDLYEAIRQAKGPKETEHVREFMLQLVQAVETLHNKGIYHRDIKPENIFLTESGNVKLGDFGLATTDAWSYETAVGSDRYMAPEQYDPASNGLAPAKADIWSMGICLLNILFSRNPFGVPAMSDPLFADYVRDRQSLFDVFPNLSQDTYEVLVHCLAIDPMKRDLGLVKDALLRVVSFTTDDEALDEFCTENREVVAATANRQPLRTPSITSPTQYDQAFPWTKVLNIPSPEKRQLSIIPDTEYASEDLFPGSEVSTMDWSDKVETLSLESVVDSGLGVSIGSSHYKPELSEGRSKPLPISGSLPAIGGRATSALAALFGKKKPFESKSWSDMYEEDEEEEKEQLEREKMAQHRPPMPNRHSKLSMLSQEDEDDDGRSTPRACLAEIKNPPPSDPLQMSQESLPLKDDNISEHTGFVFEDDKTPTAPSVEKYSPPTKRTFGDKWAALGEMRRRGNTKPSSPEDRFPPAPEQPKNRFGTATWRRNFSFKRPENQAPDAKIWKAKEWSLSKDWRRSEHNLARSPLSMHPSQLDGTADLDEGSDDESWLVGGWREMHL